MLLASAEAYRWAVQPALEGLPAVQIAAHDAGRLSRAIGGCAGGAVAVLPAVVLAAAPGGTLTPVTTAALAAAGTAVLLLARPRAGRIRRVVAGLFAVLSAVAAVIGLAGAPAAALAVLLVDAALVLIDVRADRPTFGRAWFRRTDPLLAGAALLSLSALVGWLVGPAGTPFPPVESAALVLVAGALLIRPEGRIRRPTRTPDRRPARRPFDDLLLLQSMNEAVMVLDAEQRVLDVNPRWRELTGHRAEDAVGRRPPYPWAPDPGSGDRVLQRVDGTGVPVLATMAPVPDPDGRPAAYVATYVDIAARKQAEEALADRATELEAANTRLREANSRLESALAFKTDLMSMLSHDVAQPVSSIASLSELLTTDWAELPEDIRLELATKIERNTQRLIRMMNDLSLLFRLDAGSVTARRTPVPVCEVARTVAAGLAADGVEIRVADDVSVLADRGHLWHVLQNLLTNAVKYGSPPIEVTAVQESDGVVLVVQDRGAGIPDELVPQLFDRFMKGAGLGLFIVRHLVEANLGQVRYEHAAPQGARLVVTLEAANAPVPDAGSGAGDRD